MKKIRLCAVVTMIALFATLFSGCSGKTEETNDTDSQKKEETVEASDTAEENDADASDEEEHEPVTLTYWCAEAGSSEADIREQEWLEETVRLFEEKYPWVTIEITYLASGNDYLTKMTSEISAGNVPDIFRTWLTGRLQPFVESGAVMPLNDIVENSEELSDMVTDVAKSFSQYGDEKFYALPVTKASEVVYYNRTIFDQYNLDVPTTWAEFEQVCETLLENGVTPIASGGANNDAWFSAISYMMIFQRMDENNEMYNKVCVNNEPLFDDPLFVEAAEKYMEYYNNGYYNDNYKSTNSAEASTLFQTGEAAMIFDGTWNTSTYANLDDEIGAFNFPGEDGAFTGFILNYEKSISIGADTEHPEEAALFLEFYFSKERQAAYAENITALLACQNVPYDTSKVSALDNEVAQLLETATSAVNAWDNPLGTSVGNEFNSTIQSIMLGGEPAEAFKTLNETVKLEWGWE